MTPSHENALNEDPHSHLGYTCPRTKSNHGWCWQERDSRSPCPALNTMANHGYIPRDGRNIHIINLTRGLMEAYNLSFILALFLSLGGFFLLRRLLPTTLEEIGESGRIEHPASLVHLDELRPHEPAPSNIENELVRELMKDIREVWYSHSHEPRKIRRSETMANEKAIAKARIRREKESKRMDMLHAEIARGEMAIILGVFHDEKEGSGGAPAQRIREWMQEERLPEGWKPTHVQGLWDTIKKASAIRFHMVQEKKAAISRNEPQISNVVI